MFEKAGYPIRIISPFSEIENSGDVGSSDKTGPSFKKFFDLFRLLKKANAAIAQFKPDIIIAHNYEAGLIARFLKKPDATKVVYIPHGLMRHELPFYFSSSRISGPVKVLGRIADNFVFRNVDSVVAMTDSLLKFVKKHYPARHAILIPPPFYPENSKIPDRPDKCECSIFYSGNPDGYQNLDLLFQAIKIARTEMPSLKLIVATNSASVRWLKIMDGDNFNSDYEIHYPESLPECAELAAKVGVAVLSRTDPYGFPMKIHFYVQCCLPIVAFDCGWPGLLDGETAALARSSDINALARKMIEIIRDRNFARDLAENAYNRFAEFFSPDYIMKLFEELF